MNTKPQTASESAEPKVKRVSQAKLVSLNAQLTPKVPIALSIFTALALVVFGIFRQQGTSVFVISTGNDLIQIPNITFDTVVLGWTAVVFLALLTAASLWFYLNKTKTPVWVLVLYGSVYLIALLGWIANDPIRPVPLTGLLQGALALSVPLVFGALAGVLGERVGVINIAIEGQLLFGAFAAAVVASMTGNIFAGLIAAVVAGGLIGLLLAVFSIKYIVDQIIVGVVINVLVAGFTGFMFSTVLRSDISFFNSPPRLSVLPIPLLSEIPILGPLFFRQTLIVYLMYIALAVVWFGLYKTRWGLRLRAVGEHPTAADTVGIKVNRTRYFNVMLGGMLAGLGGAFFTIGQVGAFGKDMTAGQGYIALAALIFGRWDPILAAFAALLFGFTKNLQYVVTIIDPAVPSQFMLMLPYVVTVLAVVGLVGKVRGPAASGKPYLKS